MRAAKCSAMALHFEFLTLLHSTRFALADEVGTEKSLISPICVHRIARSLPRVQDRY